MQGRHKEDTTNVTNALTKLVKKEDITSIIYVINKLRKLV